MSQRIQAAGASDHGADPDIDEETRKLIIDSIKEELQNARDQALAFEDAGDKMPTLNRIRNERHIEQLKYVLTSMGGDDTDLKIPELEEAAVKSEEAMPSLKRSASSASIKTESADSKRVDIGKSKIPAQARTTCIICGDEKHLFHSICVTCPTEAHVWCRCCLMDRFKKSLKDEELFPPKCCGQAIPYWTVQDFFSQDFKKKFDLRAIEISTENRVYCAGRDCRLFIHPKHHKAKVAKCPTCRERTCTTCKMAMHRGLCPEDKDTKAVMEFAKEKGMKSCPWCNRMIERKQGCFHMTCVCGKEFCFKCRKRYKKGENEVYNKPCKCDLWDRPEQLMNGEPEPIFDFAWGGFE